VTVVETHGFELEPWQTAAMQAWLDGSDGRPCFGTLEIVTGGGKTLIALQCFAEISQTRADVRLAVVVPTQALARQWVASIIRHTSIPRAAIGLMGAGGKATFDDHRVLVAVLSTAARRLPEVARVSGDLMLVVDECHRAGAPTLQRVLDTPADFRLGLSATPWRDETDEDGEQLPYDEQVVGRSLGPVVYRFGLREAREAGWLPRFVVHHHGVALTEEEKQKYDALSRRVDDAADRLRELGGDVLAARRLSGRKDDTGAAARAWVGLTAERKDLLYRAAERARVTQQIVSDARARGASRAILFHERVQEATELFDLLSDHAGLRVVLENSRLSTKERTSALAAFASGEADVLVSVKSLVEGIDVPAADLGVSVASTSSVRQRIQALGRVLRRGEAGADKFAEMHVIYVHDTVDDFIYGRADWSDLTGTDNNQYWVWPLGAPPVEADGPPRTPRPSEESVWEQWGMLLPEVPAPWPGEFSGQEFSVSTTGDVRTVGGQLISNSQNVGEMILSVRGRPGGRFRVTPLHRLVLVWSEGSAGSDGGILVGGQLAEPFTLVDDVAGHEPVDVRSLVAGQGYPGPVGRENGTFRIRQRAGGVIERGAPDGGREIALTTGPDPRHGNARAVLETWARLGGTFSSFHVNGGDVAWYELEGERRYLALVPGGFEFPSDTEE
jgi:superfamily II DNA or RNA helicase